MNLSDELGYVVGVAGQPHTRAVVTEHKTERLPMSWTSTQVRRVGVVLLPTWNNLRSIERVFVS
jgi:hypothetical protein